jgi:hypothetical protein
MEKDINFVGIQRQKYIEINDGRLEKIISKQQ